MKIELILPGTVRTKKNSREISILRAHHPTGIYAFFGRGRFRRMLLAMAFPRPGNAYLKWETLARVEVNKQLPKGFIKIKGPISINAQIFYKGNRPDTQGAYEAIADCLQGVIYENDSQIEHWDCSRRFHELKNPRTEIEIIEL